MNTTQVLMTKDGNSKWFNEESINALIAEGWTNTGLVRTYLFK